MVETAVDNAHWFITFFNNYYQVALKVLIILVGGLAGLYFFSRFIGKVFTHYTNKHIGILIRKMVWYLGLVIIVVMVLSELGYNIATLLGAAGVFGVAVGLASQTSLSNVVSGIFLLSEVSFKYNDLLSVGDIKGYVDSIDLLAVKLRTSDNRLIRIPNESLIKTMFINETYFSMRRFDFALLLQTDENIPRAMKIIESVIADNEHALQKPEPFILFDALEGSGIRVVVGAWARQESFLKLKQTLLNQIKERFEQEGVTLSHPQMEVNLQPFPDIRPNSPR